MFGKKKEEGKNTVTEAMLQWQLENGIIDHGEYLALSKNLEYNAAGKKQTAMTPDDVALRDAILKEIGIPYGIVTCTINTLEDAEKFLINKIRSERRVINAEKKAKEMVDRIRRDIDSTW
jgi:hypothetical protein